MKKSPQMHSRAMFYYLYTHIRNNKGKRISIINAAIAAILVTVHSASIAEEITLNASADAEIDGHINYRTNPQGASEALVVGVYPAKYEGIPESEILIRWDMDSLPDSNEVTAVTLKLTGQDWPNAAIEVYGVAEGDWDEASVTWESWVATDQETVLLGSFKSSGPTPQKGETRFSSQELTRWVQGWHDGSRQNHGIYLRMSGVGPGRQDMFSSRETKWEHGHAPQLVVTHHPKEVKKQRRVVGSDTITESGPVRGQLLAGYNGHVSPIMDLDYDMVVFLHTPEIMKRKVQLIADSGFKRLYIIAPPEGDADYSPLTLPEDGPPNFLRQSREALGGDPLAVTIALAKEVGLEVFVVFKPYEGGGVYTVPRGFPPPPGRNSLDVLGGQAIGLEPFLVEHPEMRLKRKSTDAMLERIADRIEMVFILDRIPGDEGLNRSGGEFKIELRPDQPELTRDAIRRYPIQEMTLYTSEDNGVFSKYTGDFEVHERLERRLIRNANGELAFPRAVLCRVVEIKGFSIASPYFAVQFSGNEKAFRTIPFSESCFSVFSGEQRLPVTVSPTPRPGTLTKRYGFDQNGFDFNEIGPMYWDEGWRRKTLFGIARGKAEYIRGGYCEAYPEVRDHWLSQIDRFIELGCDGVDIRLLSHSNSIADFVNYGFNPPLVEAYLEKYGIDIRDEPSDPIQMMRLRGDMFMQFAQAAAVRLHDRGLIFQMHLNDFVEHPTLDPTFPGAGFWSSPKIVPDWRQVVDLADEISIKNYNWGVYNPNLASRVKDATAAAGKPLWVHCYLQQGHDLNRKFLDDVEADERVSGLLLYEVVYRPGNVNDGIVDITQDGEVQLVPGSPIDKLLIRQAEPR